MNCKSAGKWLPLLYGNDLSPGKNRAVQAHLNNCPACQREYKHLLESLEQTREWISSERIDWEETEWQSSVLQAVKRKNQPVRTLAPWPFKPVWAVAFLALITIALSVFLIQPRLNQEKLIWGQYGIGAEQKAPQEVVTLTLVSKETGLKVNWFLNKNFNLEENDQ